MVACHGRIGHRVETESCVRKLHQEREKNSHMLLLFPWSIKIQVLRKYLSGLYHLIACSYFVTSKLKIKQKSESYLDFKIIK